VGLSVGLGADRDLGAAATNLVQVEELDLNFIGPPAAHESAPTSLLIYLGAGAVGWR
jgi:hypothetical protein